MNSIARCTCTIAVTALAAFHPQETLAEGFTGADFLTWDTQAQDSYFQTSVTMATLIAAQTKPATASCLEDWYLATPETAAARHAEILKQVQAYGGYHPSAIILVVLTNACGAFK